MSSSIFNPKMSLPLFAPTVSFSSTHTGLQHSDSWRRFNQQVETFRPASTPPEDIRPFPWTAAFKHTCCNRLPFRLETHSTGKKPAYLEPPAKLAPIVGTQLSRSTIQPSKRHYLHPPNHYNPFPMILGTV
nr:expressed protein [Hymenolepis microstoma]